MRINILQNNILVRPSFRSSNRKYLDESVKDTYMHGEISNYTYPFRGANNWFDYMDFVLENFKNKDTINFYCLGCSDCSEAYTMSLVMDKSPKLGNKTVYPIVCIDKDEGIINLAKKGRINLDSKDIYTIEYFFGVDQKFFTNPQKELVVPEKFNKNSWDNQTWMYKSYKVAPELREKVQISEGDILETVKGIKDEGNTYISLKNTIPYLTDDYKEELISELKQKLKTGSLVALDEFDRRGRDCGYFNFGLELIRNGFVHTKMKYLYRKM